MLKIRHYSTLVSAQENISCLKKTSLKQKFIQSMGMPCRHWYCAAHSDRDLAGTVMNLVHLSWMKDNISDGLTSAKTDTLTARSQTANQSGGRMNNSKLLVLENCFFLGNNSLPLTYYWYQFHTKRHQFKVQESRSLTLLAASALTSHWDFLVLIFIMGIIVFSYEHMPFGMRSSHEPFDSTNARNFSPSRSSRNVYDINRRKVVPSSVRIWGISYLQDGPVKS